MTRSERLRGGSQVAAAMMLMNVAVYLFSLVAARLLVPAELGAVTALLGILQIGNVASLGLQAATARRLAVAPEDHDEIIGLTARVTTAIGLLVGAAVAASSLVLTPLLNLDSHWLVVLAGATLVPLTIMGGLAGAAQGTERWTLLSLMYAANGLGRLGTGALALALTPSTTSAMVGVAIGAWAPVLVGAPLLRGRGHLGAHASRRPLVREAVLGTQALLAFFVLSNLDSLLSRVTLAEHDAGLYASGLILTKAALFAPQFISVIVFPLLARASSARQRLGAVLAVAAFGTVATGATALLPDVALILVGGDAYAEVADRLWLFALSGSVFAVVNLLLFDALARSAHSVTVLVWIAVGVLVGAVAVTQPELTGLVTLVAAVAVGLTVALYVRASVAGGVPGPAHADADVQRH